MIVIFFMLISLSGCAGYAIKKAKEKNTIGAYKEFIREYGDSEYAREAKRLLETLEYRNAKVEDQIHSYKRFISEYPSSVYVIHAREKIRFLKEYEKYLSNIKTSLYTANAISQYVILTKAKQETQYYNRLQRDLKAYYEAYKNIAVTRRDIIVTKEDTECTTVVFSFIGDICTTRIYAGKVLKNDLVYVSGNQIRTIHTARNLIGFSTNPGYESNNWHNSLYQKEVYGSTRAFKSEKRLSKSDLYSFNPFELNKKYLAVKYHPTTYSAKTTSGSGGILGFIDENPLTSLIIGAAVASSLQK